MPTEEGVDSQQGVSIDSDADWVLSRRRIEKAVEDQRQVVTGQIKAIPESPIQLCTVDGKTIKVLPKNQRAVALRTQFLNRRQLPNLGIGWARRRADTKGTDFSTFLVYFPFTVSGTT
jgi:hypothetical protein